MGRYIDDILQPGEKVLYSTNAHWIFYLPAIAAWIVAAVLLVLSRMMVAETPTLLCLAPAAVVAIVALYWMRHGLVPSLDHRDRRHQSARRPQDRLHQAPHLRDEPRQGRERRRQPEHSRPHPQLRQRDDARASARAPRPSRPSLRRSSSAITSPRDRSGAQSMAMQQNSPAELSGASAIHGRSRRDREILETVGRMVGSQRQDGAAAQDQSAAADLYSRRRLPQVRAQRQKPELPVRPAHPRYRLRRRPVVRAVHPARRAGDRRRSVRHQHRRRQAACRQGRICRSTIAAPPSRRWTCANASTSCWRWKWSSMSAMSACSSTAARRCSSPAG